MADITTVMALPFPEGADANDVPADMQALAERLDEAPGIESLTSAEIAALAAGEKPAGRVVYNSTTSKLQVSNGTTFANIDAAALLLAGGTMAGNIAMGGSNKVTGLAAASANGDAVRYEQLTALDATVTALGTYSAWTPTLTASGSNPGSSVTTSLCRYTQIGDLVTGTGHLTVTSAGSGTYRVSLPVAPSATSTAGKEIGSATLLYGDGLSWAYRMSLVQAPSQSYCYMVAHWYEVEQAIACDNAAYSELKTHGGSDVYLSFTFTYEAA